MQHPQIAVQMDCCGQLVSLFVFSLPALFARTVKSSKLLSWLMDKSWSGLVAARNVSHIPVSASSLRSPLEILGFLVVTSIRERGTRRSKVLCRLRRSESQWLLGWLIEQWFSCISWSLLKVPFSGGFRLCILADCFSTPTTFLRLQFLFCLSALYTLSISPIPRKVVSNSSGTMDSCKHSFCLTHTLIGRQGPETMVPLSLRLCRSVQFTTMGNQN